MEKSKHFPEFQYHYMGYYIQNKTKMNYKANFQPSELLCPKSFYWYEIDDKLKELIDRHEDDPRICPISNGVS